MDVINNTLNVGHNPHSGEYCFVGAHNSVSPTRLSQTVDLLSGNSNITTVMIDSGRLSIHFSFYYQTQRFFLQPYDLAEVTVEFHGKTNHLNIVSSGRIACTLPYHEWCSYQKTARIPTGTRKISYTMFFYRENAGGSNIYASIDDNFLSVT